VPADTTERHHTGPQSTVSAADFTTVTRAPVSRLRSSWRPLDRAAAAVCSQGHAESSYAPSTLVVVTGPPATGTERTSVSRSAAAAQYTRPPWTTRSCSPPGNSPSPVSAVSGTAAAPPSRGAFHRRCWSGWVAVAVDSIQ
jgi:hypothetical protein